MKIDFTLTLDGIVTAFGICITLAGTGWAVIRKLNQLIFVLREFPPHRHLNSEGIIFPKGMHPDDVQTQPRAAAVQRR